MFSLSTSVCPLPVPRQKELSQRDLRNGRNLNNKALWKDRPTYVDLFDLFYFNRRNFRSSQEVLQKLIFVIFHVIFI